MTKKHISVLINVTSQCNLRCKYCYHQNEGYVDNTLDLSILEDFLKKTFPYYDSVKIIWHGGEPTSPGIDYYKKSFSMIDDYARKHNTYVSHSIQTNGTLIDSDWIEFIKKYKIHMGLSFDGCKNDLTRGPYSSHKVKETSDLFKRNDIPFGYICVVNGINVQNLLEDYVSFNKQGISYKLNAYIIEESAFQNELLLDESVYINNMTELFLYWLNDETCKIHLDPFTGYVVEALIGPNLVCYRSSCLNSWIGLKPNGKITPCARHFPEQYEYTSVENIQRIEDIYHTEGFKNIICGSIERRNKCKTECDLYKYCNGGCNNCAIVDGNLNDNGGKTCRMYKGVMHNIVDYLNTNNINSDNYAIAIKNKWLIHYLEKYKQSPILENISYNT